jgi:hypothetical protein
MIKASLVAVSKLSTYLTILIYICKIIGFGILYLTQDAGANWRSILNYVADYSWGMSPSLILLCYFC